MPTSPNNERSTQRKSAAWRPGLLTLGLSGAALTLAWTLWGAGTSHPEQEDQHGAILHPSPSSSAAAMSGATAASTSAFSLTSPAQAHGGIAYSNVAPPKAPMEQQLPSVPEVDLATQARLALQSGTPKEALDVASEIYLCEHADHIAASQYERHQKHAGRDQIQLTEALERQGRCQALDTAAKALHEPLLLRSFEGGLAEASLFMATKPQLLDKLSPAQRAKVAQVIHASAAQGDALAILILADASFGLDISAQDAHTYTQALILIKQEPGGFAEVLRQWPEILQEAWNKRVESGNQLLSTAELEQARQTANAMLRNYREASLKLKDLQQQRGH